MEKAADLLGGVEAIWWREVTEQMQAERERVGGGGGPVNGSGAHLTAARPAEEAAGRVREVRRHVR